MRVADVVVTAGLFMFVAGALAADPQRGKLLYETHCGICHYEKLHERKTTAIASTAALKLEVVKWAGQTGRRFTPEEIDDVAEYLNQSHYRLAR